MKIKNLLLNNEELPKRDLFWSFGNKVAMRSGKWKLVSITKEDNTSVELFDLIVDLSEKNDLSADEPELVKEMLLTLENWQKDVWNGVTPISK